MPATGSPSCSTSRPARRVAAATEICWPSNGAHADLERIDRARNPQPGAGAHERAQSAVAREGEVDARGIGVEVEQAPHVGDEMHEAFELGEMRAQSQRLTLGFVPHLDHARRAPLSSTVRR